MSEVVVIEQGRATSDFRLKKLTLLVPGLQDAVFVHVLNVREPLSASERETLNRLFDYAPECQVSEDAAFSLTIAPRVGTISPWSSKATDILHRCGLTSVIRVERCVKWYASAPFGDSSAHLYDRMTQQPLQDLAALFEDAQPQPLEVVELGANPMAALGKANQSLGLALSEDEMAYLAAAFSGLQRDPTDVELMMFAQANSEHCRHKIFNADWIIDGAPDQRSLFARIRNTYQQINGRGVLSAYADNAAVIQGADDERLWVNADFDYEYRAEPIHILMKVETHNHPTAIAPFPGAATGSGGEIRDEGAVGRGSKPKAGLTGFTTSHLNIPELSQPWELNTPRPAHMASALDIMLQGPIGGAAFNNEYGRPCLTGYFRTFELQHANRTWGYHKPIMLAGGVGTVSESHVESLPFDTGTCLVVLGGPAMLIGLGGGAASSMASGTSDVALDFASVQRENPEMERRCQEVIDACTAMGGDNPIRLIHDVGAGGLSNALPELVEDGGTGGHIQLRRIPSADPGMAPVEIWCNEAQERYVLGIAPEHEALFAQICERERCPFAVVGYATDDGVLKVEDTLLEDQPVDMPLDLLLGKPPKTTRSFTRTTLPVGELDTRQLDLAESVQRVLQFPAVASKQFLITIGDRSITGQVTAQQMVGPWQTPVGDVAVTARGFKSLRGEAMAMGERAPLALLNPAASVRMAVAEALTNLVSADIDSVDRVVLSANWMAAAGEPLQDQGLFDAVTAVGDEFCPALGIAIPVGKDSLSMRTQWSENGSTQSVVSPVTGVISAFAPVVDVSLTSTPVLEVNQDSELFLLHLSENMRLGGSALAQVYGEIGVTTPDVESPEALRDLLEFVLQARRNGWILAQHDRSDGGLLCTLVEMAFAGRCGLDIELPDGVNALEFLFNEEVGIVVQVPAAVQAEFVAAVPAMATHLGTVSAEPVLQFSSQGESLFSAGRAELQRVWAKTSYVMQKLRDNPDCAEQEYDGLLAERSEDPGLSASLTFDPTLMPAVNVGQAPEIAILREQGVNGHMEMAAAFERAGFHPIDVHMSDLVTGRVQLDRFSALAACGGFSYGDVLGAGGGWANGILQDEKLRLQFEDFFAKRLVLGVCNGCQMLAALRDIIPQADAWPVFKRNLSEQFEARTVLVKVGDVASPWFADMAGSVLPVAVAHGEGRAEFGGAPLSAALSYVDSRGQLTEVYPANPNGSPQGVAGVLAGEGRILAMMPHPERVFRSCQNVWADPAWGDDAPWMRLFRNARNAV